MGMAMYDDEYEIDTGAQFRRIYTLIFPLRAFDLLSVISRRFSKEQAFTCRQILINSHRISSPLPREGGDVKHRLTSKQPTPTLKLAAPDPADIDEPSTPDDRLLTLSARPATVPPSSP